MHIILAMKSRGTLRVSKFCKVSECLVPLTKAESTKLLWVTDGLRRKTKGFLVNLENRTLKQHQQYSKQITTINFPLSVDSVLCN